MVTEDEIITLEDTYGANVYAKRPVVLARGKGALIWDINGKEYIDCTGSYGTCIVGYNHPKVSKSIRRQLRELTSCHSFAYNETRAKLLKSIVEISPKGLDKVFLSNSGAEAIECALKIARKATGKNHILAAIGGYHGKTIGALSATWNPKYRAAFHPLLHGFTHVPFGKIEKISEKVTDETAAILIEPIQGENGVRIPPPDYLEELRDLCNDKDILLILDEVQTGFGRTGKIFACQHYNITPDILCAAKGWAGGLPIGITVAQKELMNHLAKGEHTTTYGGNPIVAAATLATIEVLISERLPEKAGKLGDYLLKKLKNLEKRYTIVREGRGLGLIAALELRFDIFDILLNALKQQVLFLDAGRNVIRFLPPLVITRKQLDQAIRVLETLIKVKEHEIRR